MFYQPSSGLDQPLLQTRQRPILDSSVRDPNPHRRNRPIFRRSCTKVLFTSALAGFTLFVVIIAL
jgi:hypothetical protein